MKYGISWNLTEKFSFNRSKVFLFMMGKVLKENHTMKLSFTCTLSKISFLFIRCKMVFAGLSSQTKNLSG